MTENPAGVAIGTVIKETDSGQRKVWTGVKWLTLIDPGPDPEYDYDRIQAMESACRLALDAIAPCVVGWIPGTEPVWVAKLLTAVGPLRVAVGLPEEFTL